MSENETVPEPVEEELPQHRIEKAKSGRAKCRTCKRKIDKDVLRLGVLLVGPFGTGYLWHHLTCAAKRLIGDVEEAYTAEAWDAGLEVPDLEGLRKLAEKAEATRKSKKTPPYAERAPTGRAKCKHCDEVIEKDAWKVILGRAVEFGQQTRTSPINVHPACVPAEIRAEDCSTELDGFVETLTAGSGLADEEIAEVLAAIGDLDQ